MIAFSLHREQLPDREVSNKTLQFLQQTCQELKLLLHVLLVGEYMECLS